MQSLDGFWWVGGRTGCECLARTEGVPEREAGNLKRRMGFKCLKKGWWPKGGASVGSLSFFVLKTLALFAEGLGQKGGTEYVFGKRNGALGDTWLPQPFGRAGRDKLGEVPRSMTLRSIGWEEFGDSV